MKKLFFGSYSGPVQEKANVLDVYKINEKVTKTIIPTFQITYMDNSGFGAYTVQDEHGDSFSIKGTFVSELILGQTYSVDGTICLYKGEKQINVSHIKNVKPINRKGIITYLQTLQGLNSKAIDIYNEFGDKSIDVLMETPELVIKKIKGIGKKSAAKWKEQLFMMRDSQYAISNLLSYGITNRQAKKLYDAYGDDIVKRIEANPYFLSFEVKGYGFEKCDRIARNIGFDLRSSFRSQEAIIHTLEKASFSGHCYLTKDELIDGCIKLLEIRLTIQEMVSLIKENEGEETFPYKVGEHSYEITMSELKKSLTALQNEPNQKEKDSHRFKVVGFQSKEIEDEFAITSGQGRIIIEEDRIYLTNLYYDELRVAKRIVSLSEKEKFSHKVALAKELDKYLKLKGIELESMQRKAVLTFAKEQGGFFILNGSAGCGKTFTLKIIIEMLRQQYLLMGKSLNIKIFAPTGKASKVASRATGMECKTVHRGLKFKPGLGFEHNEYNPIKADCIVVDESSMMDITLTRNLLDAIEDGTKVIFMGDTKQLPSVGPGNVLRDLIESDSVKVITLNVVKRQKDESGILRNANKIINGEIIESCDDTKDAYVIKSNSTEKVIKTIIASVKRISGMDKYSFNDVQVLCPQKRGTIGTIYLNYLLQKDFNKSLDSGIKIKNTELTVTSPFDGTLETITLNFIKGDKVIHINNNYEMAWYKKDGYGYKVDNTILGITNGECGVIEDILSVSTSDGNKLRIIVNYDGKYVFYDDGYEELDHAYALTIHKSQGSSWPATIIPMMNQNYLMLNNNLFYTGYTRAESFSVVVGEESAIIRAITTHEIMKRNTTLRSKVEIFAS